MDTEKIIFEKTLDIEKAISGLWYNTNNMATWTFYKIEENERTAMLTIADKAKPTGGLFLNYEVIWVNDGKVFIDIIYSSIPKRDQHQIWITESELKIAYTNYPHTEIMYLTLKKP